ncbi:MAG: nucleotidyltransferase family protein [Erythrobacter sp.]|nr:nucleotidyltransferase family protein [Erythrobacter sp.]MDZ4272747.1 nucleotidyltransferase family protein [Erythrobacter sp.]
MPSQTVTHPQTAGQKPAVLVMAASRRGVDDPVAKLQGKAHKCLVEIDGQVMLERVLEALIDSDCFDRIHVSLDTPDVLEATPRMQAWAAAGTTIFVAARGNLADSVIAAVEEIDNPLPLVITTGDNALHTPELVRDFVNGFLECSEDVALGLSSEEVVLREFANSGLAFHQLKDGGSSSCNLYGLRNARALTAVKVFEGGGQFGKRHMRILKAFGVWPFVLYKLKLTTMRGLITAIGRRLGVTMAPMMLDYPFGPIDVDHKHSFEITEAALIRRRIAAEKAL